MVVILNGCASTKSRPIVLNTIPKSLADDALYPELQGHYYCPLPSDYKNCMDELKNRGYDVVNLITSIRNNNSEMAAIRKINR